jgi:hypothetical protein
VLIIGNYLACSDSIEDLESQFPAAVDDIDNSILAICDYGNLNLTAVRNTTHLQWDPVPSNYQTDLISYRILWQDVGLAKSIPDTTLPKEYDDVNLESCSNAMWSLRTITNETNYRLDKDMLPPWKTVVFQVRAEFRRRGIGFKSDLLPLNGTLTVPSCPIIIKSFKNYKGTNNATVTVHWISPQYYSEHMTRYRIAVKTPSVGTGSRTSDNTPCSVDTSDQKPLPCINYNYTISDESCGNGQCYKNISGLINYFDYQIQIQAESPVGCGLVSQENFRTMPNYKLDKVTRLTHRISAGPSPSTKNVQLSWIRPEYPNGGKVLYYEITIKFQVSQQEKNDFQQSHNQSVWPRSEELECNYTSGSHQIYSCRIPSNDTCVPLNFTLVRLPDRQLQYDVEVRVASALGEPSFETPKSHIKITVGKGPQNSRRSEVYIIVPVVFLCLVSIIVLLVCCLWWQKRRHKIELRSRPPSRITYQYSAVDGEILEEYVPDEWEIQRDEIALIRELGQGAFGLVYQGIWQNPDGPQPLDVAVKTLNSESSSLDRLAFLQEASVMKYFSSDHIVRLLGIVSQGTPIMVMMELMEKGDLKGYLRSLRPEDKDDIIISYETFPISEEDFLQMAVQIAAGMAYLTNKKFVHRDLAARNCMVTKDVRVKIGDFGLTRDVYQSDYYRKRGRGVLPVRWMPPESLQDGVFNHSSDVWSFGIVLWEVATLAKQPYPAKSNSEVFDLVVRGGVMDISEMKHVPKALLMIMEKCWLYKPQNRPTFEGILGCLPPLGAEI